MNWECPMQTNIHNGHYPFWTVASLSRSIHKSTCSWKLFCWISRIMSHFLLLSAFFFFIQIVKDYQNIIENTLLFIRCHSALYLEMNMFLSRWCANNTIAKNSHKPISAYLNINTITIHTIFISHYSQVFPFLRIFIRNF